MHITKNKRIWAAVFLAFLAVLCAAVWFCSSHVFVGGRAYPKNAEVLDLRDREMTPEQWKSLHTQLPGCEILWNVPFQGAYFASGTQELAVTALSEEDLPVLDCFTQLQRLEGEGCGDYAVMAAFQARRPEVEVSYSVPIDGQAWPWNTEELYLTGISDAELPLLQFLPHLKTVDAAGIQDLTRIPLLQQALPGCSISYQVTLGAEAVPHTAQSLSLSGADPAELAEKLPYLPQVTTVFLQDPVPNAQALLALPEQFPGISFSWQSELSGITVTQAATEVDLTDIPLESTEALKEVLACYPSVETLILSGCGLDNETLAAFREEVRDQYKVVWTVEIGPAMVRTDVTYLIPIKYDMPHLQDDQVYNLRYCEEMQCIDLGHHGVSHCDWAAFMPNLKYLILADTRLRDISGLQNCKNLVFLEIFLTPVKDLTPLEGCTALEDLNLSFAWYADPTPVSRMPWLKRLWWAECPWSEAEFRQYLPDTEFSFVRRSSTGGTWRQGQNYYDMRDFVGMEYMIG